MWHYMLSRLLLHFPNPKLSLRLVSMEVDEMKRWVLHSAKLDRTWHKIDYHPRVVRNFHCDKRVEHVNLVAGGDWLVIVLHDGSLQLHELGAAAPAATLSQSLTQDESVVYLSSRLSLTHEREDLIILQMGVRYEWVHFLWLVLLQASALIFSVILVRTASAIFTFTTSR